MFSDENSGKSMKKPRRSPFSIFRRGKDDKNNNSSPTGKLFGRPIDDLVIDGGLPKAVMVRKTYWIILKNFLREKKKKNLRKFDVHLSQSITEIDSKQRNVLFAEG